MSITKPLDGWDQNAAKLLRRRIFSGSPDASVNYAPDFRDGEPGPLTIQISKILQAHAALWAQDMRDIGNLDKAENRGESAWLLHMREADAEIKRYLAGPTFKPGAAA